MQSRVYFYRKGQELADHKANGFTLVGSDGKTGIVKNITCRRGILVADPRLPGRQWHVGPEDFDGPVMVKVVTGDKETKFALATAEQVKQAGGTPATEGRYMPRDGRKLDAPHEPFDAHPAHRPGGLFEEVKIRDVPFEVVRWRAPAGSLWRQWQREAVADFRRRNPRAV